MSAAHPSDPWRASLHALRRAPWLLLPLLAAALVLPAADLIPSTPNPYEIEALRPIDARTKAICMATTLVGLLVGWVAGRLSTEDVRAGRSLAIPPSFYGFRSLPAHRATVAGGVAFGLAACGLVIADIPTWLAIWLATMACVQASTVALLMPVLVRGHASEVLAFAVLAAIASASLLSATGSPLVFTTALVPTFWVGHTLTADQIGINRGMAAFVGVCMNLLPLVMAIGLNLADREAERRA